MHHKLILTSTYLHLNVILKKRVICECDHTIIDISICITCYISLTKLITDVENYFKKVINPLCFMINFIVMSKAVDIEGLTFRSHML